MSSGGGVPLDALQVPLVGRHVVEASAGTGKTFTITTLVVRLVVERAVPIDQILVVTFTRAATSELRDRIRRRLSEALALLHGGVADPVLTRLVAAWPARGVAHEEARQRLDTAVQAFDQAPVLTIHGFCQRVLRDHAFEGGVPFGLELVQDTGPWLAEVAQDLWTTALHDADRDLVAWLQGHLGWKEVVGIVTEATRAAAPRFLPEGVVGPLEVDGGQLREAFKEARAAWHADGEAFCEAIVGCAALNKGAYGARNVGPRKERLHQAFALPDLPLDLDDLGETLDYFSLERLEGRLKGDATAADLPEHPLFDVLHRFHAVWEAHLGPEGSFVQARVQLCRTLAAQARPRLVAARGRGDELRFFDDLISDLRDALVRPGSGPRLAGALRQAFPVALIDEFQDTDAVQFDVFDAIYRGGEATVYLIGDPKQAIYAFRGADVYAYLAAREDVAGEARARGVQRIWNLDVNFRSDRPLVDAVNHLFAQPLHPFGERRIPFEPVGAHHPTPRLLVGGKAPAPLRFRFHAGRGRHGPRVGDLAAAVGDDVAALLGSDAWLHTDEGRRPLGPGDVAVLVSSHWEAAQVQAALEARGVPCVRYGNVRVFQTEEAGVLTALLEALLHAGDLRRVRAALVTPVFGLTGDDLAGLEADDARLQHELTRLRGWRETWESRGFMRMFQDVLRDTRAVPRVLGLPGGERCLTNLRHLAELVHAAEQEGDLRPVGVAAWVAGQRAGRADDQGPAEVRLESDGDAVRVVTMHVSKGLEYPVVFCPSVWRSPRGGVFPRFHDAHGRLCVQLQPEAHAGDGLQALEEARAERMRLAYVALTRARHLCVVNVGRFSSKDAPGFEGGPLAHLLFPADRLDPDAGMNHNLDQVRKLGDDELRVRLRELAEGSAGGIDVQEVDLAQGPVLYRPARPPVALALAQRPPRAFPPDVRISSFSGLVRARHDAEHDLDAYAARAVPAPSTGPAEPLPLADLPRGARSGTAYHAILEHVDFGAASGPEAAGIVAAQLRRHGLDAALVDAVLASVAQVCATPLGDGAPALGEVPRARRLDELEFLLPAGASASLTPARLAAAFAGHGDPLADRTAERVAGLGFGALQGSLTGFVDLVFQHEGRFYVVDHKTNHLGDRLDDYAPDRVAEAMIAHDYVLQGTLYLVALHRLLARRLPDYAYASHIGGLRYLFVRGMQPEAGASRGVFSWTPPLALVQAVDRALGGEA